MHPFILVVVSTALLFPLGKCSIVGNLLAQDVKLAGKSVLASSYTNGFCVGVACSDGVLLAAVRPRDGHKRGEDGSGGEDEDRRNVLEQTRGLDLGSPHSFGKCIYKLETDLYVAISGWQADSAYLIRQLREVCARHRNRLGTSIDARELAEETSRFLYTQSTEESSVRPLVVSVLIGGTLSGRNQQHYALETVLERRDDEDINILRYASRLTDACLFKIDTAGVLDELSVGATGSFNSEDLSLLQNLGADGQNRGGDAGERGEPVDEEAEVTIIPDATGDGASNTAMLRHLTETAWHEVSMDTALRAISDKYDVVDNNLEG